MAIVYQTEATIAPRTHESSSWGPNGDFENILFVIDCFVLVILTEATFHNLIVYREQNAIRHPASRRHQQEQRLEDGLATTGGEEIGEAAPLLPRDTSNDDYYYYSSCPVPSTSQMRETDYDTHQDGDDDSSDERSHGRDENYDYGDHYYNGEAYVYMRDIFGPKRSPPVPLPEYIMSFPRRR